MDDVMGDMDDVDGGGWMTEGGGEWRRDCGCVEEKVVIMVVIKSRD